jgi:hypothetical protein
MNMSDMQLTSAPNGPCTAPVNDDNIADDLDELSMKPNATILNIDELIENLEVLQQIF